MIASRPPRPSRHPSTRSRLLLPCIVAGVGLAVLVIATPPSSSADWMGALLGGLCVVVGVVPLATLPLSR
jgi:hypothetical protein